MNISYKLMSYIFLDIWAPRHSDHLLPGTSHITAFLAACMIGDKLIQRTDNSTSIDYRDDDSKICWSHKLYLLPMTLATQSAGMKQRNLVNRVLIGWDKGEMILLLADEMGISRYLAWKILMSARFNVDMTVNALQKLKCS